MLEVVHYIHISAAAVFIGSVIFFDWGVGGALARLPVEDRLRFALSIRPYSGRLIMASLGVTLIAGIGRLFLSGAIQSVGDLFIGYGLKAMIALTLVIASEGIAAPLRKRMRNSLVDLDDAEFQKQWRRHRALNTGIVVILLGLMTSMRMG